MPYLGAEILGEALRAFQLRRRRGRAEDRDAGRRADRRRCPATSGASGPTTTRSIALVAAEGDDGRMVGDVERDAVRLTRAMPGLPGAA